MIGSANSAVTLPSTIIFAFENLAIDSPVFLSKGKSVDTNRRLKLDAPSSAQSKSEIPTVYVPLCLIVTSVYVAGMT